MPGETTEGLEGLLDLAKGSLAEARNLKDQNTVKWIVHLSLEYEKEPEEIVDLLEKALEKLKERKEPEKEKQDKAA